jgi:hypothetical protein
MIIEQSNKTKGKKIEIALDYIRIVSMSCINKNTRNFTMEIMECLILMVTNLSC